MPADNEPWALNDDGWEPDEDGEAWAEDGEDWAEDGEDWAEDGEDWAEDGGTSGSATPEPVPELFEAGFLPRVFRDVRRERLSAVWRHWG